MGNLARYYVSTRKRRVLGCPSILVSGSAEKQSHSVESWSVVVVYGGMCAGSWNIE